MWIDEGPRAMATAHELLERMARARRGERIGDEVELDDDGQPMVMEG